MNKIAESEPQSLTTTKMKKLYFFCTLAYLLIGTSLYAQYTKLLDFERITNGNFALADLYLKS